MSDYFFPFTCRSCVSPFSHTAPPLPAGQVQVKSSPSSSQVPPWPQGCESHGPGALACGRMGLVWKDMMVVVLAEVAVVGFGGLVVVGEAVVILRVV